jgi:4'-phosphopantetheinyl transferase
MESPSEMAWPEPPEFPALGPASIHLWCAWLDEPSLVAPAAAGLLAPDERARAARFHFATDRQRCIAARVVLRRLLGRYAGVHPAALRFAYGPYGKPELVPLGGTPPVQFNLSHCGPLALLGVARNHRVGVDVERVRALPDLLDLESQLFAREALPRTAPEPARRNHFFHHWTRREAAGKLQGSGLVDDAPVPDWIESLEPAADHVGCLAYNGEPAQVERFTATPALMLAPWENIPAQSTG